MDLKRDIHITYTAIGLCVHARARHERCQYVVVVVAQDRRRRRFIREWGKIKAATKSPHQTDFTQAPKMITTSVSTHGIHTIEHWR